MFFNKVKTEYIKSKPNILSILLERYPEKGWNIDYLSENPYAIEYIKNHPEKPWNWTNLNFNINIDIELLRLYRDRMYRWDLFTVNHNITMDIISKNSDLPWDYNEISKNPNITEKDIENYPIIPWNFDDLSSNINISEEFIEAHPEYKWNYCEILCKRGRLSKILIKRLKKLHIRDVFELNINLFKYFEIHTLRGYEISRINSLDTETIEKFINSDLDWYYISAINRNLTLDFVKKYIEKFQPYYLSSNPCLTSKFLEDNPSLDWCWHSISRNSNIDLEYIEKVAEEKNMEWLYISENENLTLEFIERHINKINFEQLSANIFTYDDTVYQRELKKDIEKRRKEVKGEIKDIFYNDICGEILKFISYD